MSTVIAMISGRSVHEVIDTYDHEFCARNIWYDRPLRDYGITYLRGHLDRADLMSGFAHLFTVPSLNIPGDFHAVLLVWAIDQENPIVLDPNYLRDGKHFYVFEASPDEPMAHTLINWRVDVYIPLLQQGIGLEVERGQGYCICENQCPALLR
jgi:hypothetical protein